MFSQFLHKTVTCSSERETSRIAQRLGKVLVPGTVIALNGPMGAGKTWFVRALATSQGVPEDLVNSPTYVIGQHYPGQLMLHHFDLYRLVTEDEWYELGGEEFLESDGVCLIEWAHRFPDILPADFLNLEIEPIASHVRTIRATASGEISQNLLKTWLLEEDCSQPES